MVAGCTPMAIDEARLSLVIPAEKLTMISAGPASS